MAARVWAAWERLVADQRVPAAILAAAGTVVGIALVAAISNLTFLIDDWDFLLDRRGFSVNVFFEPHAGHPSMSLIAVYKAIQATIGMESITPYAIASTLTFLATIALLFVWLRRRIGDWPALIGALLCLGLGSAYEDLLTPFQLGYFAPVACGLAAMLALESENRRGDIIACALLVLGLSFQTVGLVFVVGIAVGIALERRARERWWVVVVPAALYGLWYLGWHSSEADQLSFDNIATSPAFILDGYAAAVGSVVGLTGEGNGTIVWGRPLLAGLLLLAGLRIVALGRIPRGLWVVLAIGASFWFLIAVNASFLRTAETSRYQFPGAVFVVMAAAELLRGMRPDPRVIAVACVATLAAIGSGIATLEDRYQELKSASALVRGNLAALEIAADTVDPNLVLTPDNSGFNYFTLVRAGPYLSAAEDFGSPAYSVEELASATDGAREGADRVLAPALGLELAPADRTPASGCTVIAGTAPGKPSTALPPGGAILSSAPGPGAEILVRRYASQTFPVDLGLVPAGESRRLEIPADASEQPWQVQVQSGGGTLEVCPL